MSGGKYAKKHQKQKEQEKQTAVARVSAPLSEFFDDSFNFIKIFKTKNVDTQIYIVRVLHDIIKKDEQKPSHGKDKYVVEQARYFLSSIHKLANCSYDHDIFYPLAKDEKRLIRMECHGTIDRRRDDELSCLYKYFQKRAAPKLYPASNYRLANSPSWKVFHQFESFRSIEPKIRKYLRKSGIHPDALSVMTVNDFCDVIYHTFKTSSSDLAVRFLDHKDTIRGRQNLQVMQYCGNEVERLLLKKGIDYRCVKSYCDMVRRFGTTDINSLVVTERQFTPRILNDLANKGFDVSQFKPKMPIPQSFIDHMIDNGYGDLLLARDKKGNPLDKSKLPRMEDHHNKSVMLARKEDTIAATNYPNNHISVDARIHHQYLHLFDTVMHSGNIEQISSRLNVQDGTMRVLLGFDAKEDAIYYDLEQTEEFQKRKTEDLKCKVNYFDMMQKRMQNEAKIIQKHKIPTSKAYVKEGLTSLREIKDTSEYNKAAMRQIEKLLKEGLSSKKHKKSKKEKKHNSVSKSRSKNQATEKKKQNNDVNKNIMKMKRNSRNKGR